LKIYKKKYGTPLEIEKEYPCLHLTIDLWDDSFAFETLFRLTYFENELDSTHIGKVKIMHKDQHITRNYIDDIFESLSEDFCSLGQDVSYYYKLKQLGTPTYTAILKALNDVVLYRDYFERYKSSRAFKISLTRFSEAEKALKEGLYILEGRDITKDLAFNYSCKLDHLSSPHEIFIDFNTKKIPYRMHAFVGKNGTGKTSILNHLSRDISGVNSPQGTFLPSRPNFSKIITISYSAFDEMYKPFEDEEVKESSKNELEEDFSQVDSNGDGSKLSESSKKEKKDKENILFSYIYCGLRSSQGFLSISELEEKFRNSYSIVKFKDRQDTWKEIMSNVFEEEHFALIEEICEEDTFNDSGFSRKLSSGQNILLYTMTEVIANIQEDSLLLFDEPEIHLHPNAISNFMRMYYKILEEFNSYSIMCTHSPLIVQEMPSQYVRVFTKISDSTIINNPEKEYFGENISNITNGLFEVRSSESNYKAILKNLFEKGMSTEEIIELFNNELSYNALTYLSALEDEEEEI